MAMGILWQQQLELANDAIGASYVLVGQLTKPARCILFSNLTNADIQVSMGGMFFDDPDWVLSDSFPVAARTGIVIDVTSNSKPTKDDGAEQDNLTNVYVKLIGAAPGTFTGSFYVSYWCEKGE